MPQPLYVLVQYIGLTFMDEFIYPTFKAHSVDVYLLWNISELLHFKCISPYDFTEEMCFYMEIDLRLVIKDHEIIQYFN